jgi:hypothetical protein
MAQHFHIDQAYQELPQALARESLTGTLLEYRAFIYNDAVFLLRVNSLLLCM